MDAARLRLADAVPQPLSRCRVKEHQSDGASEGDDREKFHGRISPRSGRTGRGVRWSNDFSHITKPDMIVSNWFASSAGRIYTFDPAVAGFYPR
jgi:hypothetical protein